MKIVASDYYNNLASDDRIPHRVQAAALALPDHRSHLDDLRPGPEDDCNGHV